MPLAIRLDVEHLTHRANKGDCAANRQLLLLDHLLHPHAERIRANERAVNDRAEALLRRAAK